MKAYRIVSVEPAGYPMVKVTFEDGFAGEIDMGGGIADGSVFAPLADRSLFDRVSVAPDGRGFGWRLDDPGNEIDLCADSIRIDIETQKVHELAEHYRRHRPAAE